MYHRLQGGGKGQHGLDDDVFNQLLAGNRAHFLTTIKPVLDSDRNEEDISANRRAFNQLLGENRAHFLGEIMPVFDRNEVHIPANLLASTIHSTTPAYKPLLRPHRQPLFVARLPRPVPSHQPTQREPPLFAHTGTETRTPIQQPNFIGSPS